ncbi:MAG TPA: NADH-quinone oxidoreductase subunit H [Methanoculleus sp.]|jgi:formate hydrogenlyase subunit 4|uniref:respiratory chain complex I subunit 1 family protein n=1 Tax=Methanoculleus sp. TaxID=90427 RepID=UPI000A4D9482|nr:NADH-quinone oxidoreductase subunit H [Methanoculleus sp.]MBP7144200.1 NADH-quinone oxidoreductase subunit H [Methanoculleus sp.]HNT06835.1 NADH-quinone oxidoreductase subunit H [Methanoculleus sp.]HOC83424.1 NADH-quinone oxidoreductase subunit H [Methanoculleus sp.]HOF95932.1 NADH-quinone oxidoreductase subunit H [Methanoculleus sp.]HOI62028.1 NADH-quinone oxidoreductase subunit H [Methanoculleus sp.]
MNWLWLIGAVLFLVLAPVAGGLIAGIDRKITARMQGRVGPPILQPFYDVGKLFEKERVVVTTAQNFYVLAYLVFIALSGAIFFAGGDLLLTVFAFTLAHVFLVLGAYAVHSPYSHIGAERELIQVMAYEPMIILVVVGFYMVTGSFFVDAIAAATVPAIAYLPGVFIGFAAILTIKLRKSPFDISTSHHAHQEIVKGITTEFSGSTLAQIEIAHWYENIFLLGLVYLFFAWNPVIAIIAVAVTYVAEIYIDNVTARVRWQAALKSGWLAAALGIANLAILSYMMIGGA